MVSRDGSATDWIGRMGRRGFEALVDDLVRRSIGAVVKERVEPRFASIEDRLAAIESRLDVADRLAKWRL